MKFRKKKAKVRIKEPKVTVGIKRCNDCERNLRCSECACLAQKEIFLEEVKKLKIENQSLRAAANSYKLHYNETRAEAVREFAEMLKNHSWIMADGHAVVDIIFVNNLVKEIAGDTE